MVSPAAAGSKSITPGTVINRAALPAPHETGATPPPAGPSSYTPRIPDRVDHDALVRPRGRVLRLPRPEGRGPSFRTYEAFHLREGAIRGLWGKYKTLCFEGAFLLYVTLSVRG